MQTFIKLFVRVAPGLWTCVRNGEFEGPRGRIQVSVGSTFAKGTSFMGIDLAHLLEEESQKVNGNAVFHAPEHILLADNPIDPNALRAKGIL